MTRKLTILDRMQKIADKNGNAKCDRPALNHVHIENGIAYITDGISMISTPTDNPDCVNCETPAGFYDQISRQTSNLVAMMDVTHQHVKRGVKTAAAMYSGATAQDKRENSGKKIIALSANGSLDISAKTEWGTTKTTLKHNAEWNEKWIKSKNEYKKSQVYYMKAGEDVTAKLEAQRFLNILQIIQPDDRGKIEITVFNSDNLAHGVIITNGTEKAVLCGCFDD